MEIQITWKITNAYKTTWHDSGICHILKCTLSGFVMQTMRTQIRNAREFKSQTLNSGSVKELFMFDPMPHNETDQGQRPNDQRQHADTLTVTN